MMMAEIGWQRTFEDPIALPDGRELVTLRDGADYITSLPEKETDLSEWQVAMEALKRSHDDGADRGHEGAEPPRRAGVQSRSQGNTLGEAQA